MHWTESAYVYLIIHYFLGKLC